MIAQPLLEIRNLCITYRASYGDVRAVSGLDLAIGQNEVFGLVGESGCGKSTLVKALLRLLPPGTSLKADVLRFKGRDLTAITDSKFRRDILMQEIALVPQSAQNSLNPVQRVGTQITEAIRAHTPISRTAARDRIVELFDIVGLQPELMDHYPHQFSGGMRQRVMIATALALEPALLVMDEPTTGLDVLVQERLLRRIREIRKRVKSSILLVTHDIGVIAQNADKVGVMYAGRMVEQAPTAELFERPWHPYTLGLKNAFPSIMALGKELISIPGSPPDLSVPLDTCGFAARCPFAIEPCRAAIPETIEVAAGRYTACFRNAEMDQLRVAATEKATWHS